MFIFCVDSSDYYDVITFLSENELIYGLEEHFYSSYYHQYGIWKWKFTIRNPSDEIKAILALKYEQVDYTCQK